RLPARCWRRRSTSPGAGVPRAGLVAARVAAVPAGVGIVVAATGWLYVVTPHVHLPGPKGGGALPLDQLARHSAAPLPPVLLAWGGAALALGSLARLLSLSRLAAALLLCLFVGAWSYVSTAVSILVVRQIAAESAFRDAATLRAVLLPAVLAALAGALLARGG